MLAKKHRLLKSTDFNRVRQEGRGYSCRTLVLVKHRNQLDLSRFGFSVSKRIGNAVVRNRIKRRLSEAVRLHLDLIDPGWDVVMIARRPVVYADYWEAESAVVDLLSSAGLFRAEDDESAT